MNILSNLESSICLLNVKVRILTHIIWIILTCSCAQSKLNYESGSDLNNIESTSDAIMNSIIDARLNSQDQEINSKDAQQDFTANDLQMTDLMIRDFIIEDAQVIDSMHFDDGRMTDMQFDGMLLDIGVMDAELVDAELVDAELVDAHILDDMMIELDQNIPTCGNGIRERGEACDDGNEETEICLYGQQNCMVCDAECRQVAGETQLCGDNILNGNEICDHGEDNSNQITYACRTDCQPDFRDAIVPFLQESYIVQGVASSCESLEASECVNERVYLSLYFKDAEGNTTDSEGYEHRKSLFVELNPNSQPAFMMTRCWQLTGELAGSHVGGLAYAKDSQNRSYLYTSGASKIERYSLIESPSTTLDSLHYGSLAQCTFINADRLWAVQASSYVSHVKRLSLDYLLVGRFCKDSSACSPYAYAYPLDMTTGEISVPHTIKFKIRFKAQGIEIDDDDIYVSVSYGSNDSYLYRDRLNDALCLSDECNEATVNNVSRVTVKGGIAGGEDLARVGRKLWSASESGSRHFQNRGFPQLQWDYYYPYVYDINIGIDFDSPQTPIDDAINSRHAKNVRTILSDTYPDWWDRYDLIRVMDINGDEQDDLVLGPDEDTGCWYVLEGHSGILHAEFLDRGCVIQGYANWHDNPDRIRVMDVNGDGKDDLVIGPHSQTGCWSILQGQMNGESADFIDRGCQVNYKENWYNKTDRIRAMDVDGNGADDIVIGPSSEGNWYILEGKVNPVADFQAGRLLDQFSPKYGGWYDNAERIKVMDANADGKDDLVIGPYSQNGCWYLIEGSANPTRFIDRDCVVQAYDTWYDKTERFWIADFNGDGADDIVLGPSGANGCWYLLTGSTSSPASLTNQECIHQNYESWWEHSRRIRIMHARPQAAASILIGPKIELGEWQLLQGNALNQFYDKQWLVSTKDTWGEEDDGNHKPERIWVLDVNGDHKDDVVIGPSSNGFWYLIEGR
jgi:hypothetical protein